MPDKKVSISKVSFCTTMTLFWYCPDGNAHISGLSDLCKCFSASFYNTKMEFKVKVHIGEISFKQLDKNVSINRVTLCTMMTLFWYCPDGITNVLDLSDLCKCFPMSFNDTKIELKVEFPVGEISSKWGRVIFSTMKMQLRDQ